MCLYDGGVNRDVSHADCMDPDSGRDDSLDLPSHRQTEENKEVYEQDRPVDWHVANLGESAAYRDEDCLRSREPKLGSNEQEASMASQYLGPLSFRGVMRHAIDSP